jgi:type IX secretion system PorP/SprF family membrane protein
VAIKNKFHHHKKPSTMKKLLTLILTSYCLSTTYAQQTAQYSLYMLNPYGSNPAAAGLENTLVATGGYRTQWVGIEGNPQTQYINVSLPIAFISSGVGLAVENDRLGARGGLSVKASYSFIKRMGDAQLAIGVSGGILQGSLDGTKLRTPNGDYAQGVLDHRDKALNMVALNGITPNFEAGIYFKNTKIEGGISVQNLTEPSVSLESRQVTNLQLKRHYTGFAAAHFDLFAGFTIHPSLFVKTDGTEMQADFSTLFRYDNNFFLGASFRGMSKTSQDAVVILGGFKLNSKFNVAYAYDIGLSALKTANNGSHELVLQYSIGKEFGRGKLPPVIYNPRF